MPEMLGWPAAEHPVLIELAPNVGPARGRTSRSLDQWAAGLPNGLHELHRGLVADGAVWWFLVVLSPISLALRPGIVQDQEPVLVDAPGPHLAVAGFDEGSVRRLAGPGTHSISPVPARFLRQSSVRSKPRITKRRSALPSRLVAIPTPSPASPAASPK